MQAMNRALAAVLCLVALLVGAAIAGFLAYRKGVQSGVEQRKQQAEAAIGSAEKEAGRILEDAKKEAEAKRKNAMVEAKDEIYKLRSEAEKETRSDFYGNTAQSRQTLFVRCCLISSDIPPAHAAIPECTVLRHGWSVSWGWRSSRSPCVPPYTAAQKQCRRRSGRH